MARPVIANIRRGDPDGNVWDLDDLENDEFFALNDNTSPDPDVSAFDSLIAMLRLDGTGLTAADLDAYEYAFFGTNRSDTITGVTELEGDPEPDTEVSGVIASGNGHDQITAGSGDHVIFAGNGKDSVGGGAGNDIIFGENGKDVLAGNTGDDEIRGGTGKDTLNGGNGDDVLTGNNGVDVLTGGEGGDDLTGGNGGDEFHWNTVEEFGDVITDFTAGSDKLVFDVGEDPAISIGNDDVVVDDGEVVIETDTELADDLAIQAAINDDYGDVEDPALFAFIDSDKGHAVLYYDGDRTADDDAVLVADLTNITTLEQLGALSTSDFVFV
jgi:Ca2+-binding RTX toxin-like protein